jgi:hypothetical protein
MRNSVAAVLGTVVLAGVVTTASAAMRAWHIDDVTGVGFVGKGDVQLALGLNNKQMQDQANGLSFSYADVVEYSIECQKTVGSGATNYNSYERERSVASGVAYDVRRSNQVNGFNLKEFTSGSGDAAPVACPGGWTQVPDTEPEILSATGGVLKVNGVPID